MSKTHSWWENGEHHSEYEDEGKLDEGIGDDAFRAQASKKPSQISRRIHILGAGNVGTFVAHSLAGIPNRPPVTLLLKGVNHLKSWKEANETLSVTTRGMTDERRGFDVELLPYERPDSWPYQDSVHMPTITERLSDSTESANGSTEQMQKDVDQSNELQPGFPPFPKQDRKPISLSRRQSSDFEREIIASRTHDESIIHHLIVTTKAYAAAKAISQYAHRLTEHSTILFLQNGLGVLDEVSQLCFPDPATRPQYMVGVNSHGLKRKGRFFDVRHAGEGTIALGIMPQPFFSGIKAKQSLASATPSSQYMLRTMTRTPVFVAAGFPPTDLFQLQLDKLAINSIINPITALLNVKNGAFNETFHLTRVLRLLLAETCLVLKSLPELKNVPNVNMRFDTARVEQKVWEVTRATAENDSSMLQDVRTTNWTEVDYINGYIIKRGEELGMHCVLNYMLKQLLEAKSVLYNQEKNEALPFAPFPVE